jgi:hypothetical protein
MIALQYETKPLAIITDAQIGESSAWPPDNRMRAEPFSVHALWDTGSEICAISKTLVDQLNLVKFTDLAASGFGAVGQSTPVYVLDLTLPDGYVLHNVLALEYSGSNAHDFIIGMNVITLGKFSLTPVEDGIKFCFQ